MRSIITVSLFTLLLINSFASNHADIDRKPKHLQRELEKKGLQIDSAILIEGIGDNNPKGAYFQTTNLTDSLIYYIGRVNSCRANGCAAGNTTDPGEDYEFFDYYILFDTKGMVKTVKVFNYQATHGQEITIKGWLKQFIGYLGEEELVVGKDIDAVAGATISVYAITTDVEYRTKCLNRWLNK